MPPKKKGAKPEEEKAETKEAEKEPEKTQEADKAKDTEKAKEPAKEAEAQKDKPAEDKPAEDKPAEAEETEKEEEKPKEPEKPKELEEDSPPAKGKKVSAGSVCMDMSTATMNVMLMAGGSVLMTLTDGGLQYLLASVRSNTGIKSGRYLFEMKILESLNPAEGQGGKARAPAPRQLVRVGLSTQDSSIFLSDGPDNVCFDSEGYFIHEKKRAKVSQKFSRDQVVGLLLNLDASSPNKNTVSLFRDGVRVSEPQPLPENLHGKPLFPTITYRNVTVQLNYGPEPLAQMPFKCRMLNDASVGDVQLKQTPSNEKNKVVFPVGLPDTGVFDWVDGFLAKNPSYTELSDRKILEWASKSGLWRQKGYSWRASNDKPEMGFGIPFMDDTSVSRLLTAIAPTLKRNYVVMELKGNLVADDRAAALKRFSKFETSASVLMGEPNGEYKALVQELLLSEKKKKAEAEKKKKAMEAERKRLAEERAKKAEAAKKARLQSQKKDGDKEEEAKEEEPKEEEKDEAPAEDDTPAPELTEEEKKLTCRKLEASDLLPAELAKAFADFSLPSKDEGFSKVDFEWQGADASAAILKEYVHEKKTTQRIEGLKPGEWFAEEWKKWQKTYQDWKRRQMEWKDPNKKKQIVAKKKEANEKKAKESLGDDASKEDVEAATEKIPEVNAEDIDIWADVKEVMDIGSGEPLFFNFAYEDWTLLSVRFELHLLAHAFKKDVNDPERPSFVENHLAFYYNKYFKKAFNVKMFGVNDNAGLIDFIKDTVKIDAKSMLEAALADDTPLDNFVKQTEDHRRERQRRMDAGDETAQLKFTKPSSPPPPKQAKGPQAPTYPPAAGKRPAVQGSSYGASTTRYGSQPSYGGAQKRPYTTPASSYPAAKAPRYGGGSGYGGQGGYRR